MSLALLVLAVIGGLLSIVSAVALVSAASRSDKVMEAVGISGIIIGAALAARLLYVRKHPEHKRDFQNTYWL